MKNGKKRLPQSRIGANTRLEGTLNFGKQLLIHGQFRGTINGGELLIVDRSAHVEGDIEVDTIIVRGNVRGKITARTSIVLEAGSVVAADIHTTDVRIAEHARYEGRCVMSIDT